MVGLVLEHFMPEKQLYSNQRWECPCFKNEKKTRKEEILVQEVEGVENGEAVWLNHLRSRLHSELQTSVEFPVNAHTSP